jgi:hypothetical protein
MLLARLLATAVLWLRSQTSLKIQNERHKQRSGQHTPARQKITKKKFNAIVRCENNIIFSQENVIHTICD